MGFFSEIGDALTSFDPFGIWDEISGAADQREALERAQRRSEQAMGEQMDVMGQYYDEARGYYQPYQQGGLDAYNQLLAQMGMGDATAMDYMNTPMARAMQEQFRMKQNQALQEIKNTLAGQGLLYSGDTSAAMGDYFAKYTPDYYGAFMGNMGQLANQGMGVNSALANMALQQGTNIANLIGGNAATMNEFGLMQGNLSANSFNNLLNTGLAAAQMYMGMPPVFTMNSGQQPMIMDAALQYPELHNASSAAMGMGGMNAYQQPGFGMGMAV